MRALFFLVELLLMVLLEINVNHFIAYFTFFYVPSAITEMGGHFGLGKVFPAIVTPLKGLIFHKN
jgi:hypothetical protein